MSDVEVENPEEKTVLDALKESGDDKNLPDMGGPVDNQGEPKKPKTVTAKPYKKPAAYLLFDGTEDAAYMCVRMARDKEYQSMCVCTPKFKDGNANKIWSDLKPLILNENKSTKFQDLSNNATDVEACILEIAETVKNQNTLIFIPWSGERMGGTQTIYRKLRNSLPEKIEKMGNDNNSVLRVVFPNEAHGQEHFTHNRENLNTKNIFDPPKKKPDT